MPFRQCLVPVVSAPDPVEGEEGDDVLTYEEEEEEDGSEEQEADLLGAIKLRPPWKALPQQERHLVFLVS